MMPYEATIKRIMEQHSKTLEYLHMSEKQDELVEKVARAIAYELGYTWGSSSLEHDAFREAARAALRVALEEAARVTEQPLGGMYKDVEVRGLYAAAIRALIPKE